MFRIRKILDADSLANRTAIEQVRSIARERFPLLAPDALAKLAEQLVDPLRFRFRSILFVAEGGRDQVRGFALLLHLTDLGVCYLDLLAVSSDRPGRGIGDALYQRVREEAKALKAAGIFLEALPDEPALSRDPEIRKRNEDRLRFYERYGARPIANTRYEVPIQPGGDNPPYLVFDGLDGLPPPSREAARRIVRAILERKYGSSLPAGYVDMVVASFTDDPVQIRPPRHTRSGQPPAGNGSARPQTGTSASIALVVTDQHAIHHVRERGYVESPVRIRSILGELDRTELFRRVPPRHFGEQYIRAVHDGGYVDYLQRACAMVEPGKSIYPYVFPIRNPARRPKDVPVRAGYYCIDTFTPLNRNAYLAAKRAVDCALTAADAVLGGDRLAYALVRPPGHHAERRSFGGFCYFNNAAVAAQYLSRYGRVAVLDIDYHHGNGTQDIFYARSDVLTVSIHGHPSFAYPYFSGFRDETGEGEGAGFNLNLPLPEVIDGEHYREALAQAIKRIQRFAPTYLVVAAGFDTAAGDPTGTFSLRPRDFFLNGQMIGRLPWPVLVVQEGGYRTRSLGPVARQFFTGLSQGRQEQGEPVPRPQRSARAAAAEEALVWRDQPRPEDSEAVREIVASSSFFSMAETEIAVELVEDRLNKGLASGYYFLFAERGGRVVGYACFGPTPGTRSTWDLYWIAVKDELRGAGLGRQILEKTEAAIAREQGSRIYVETSTRRQYEPTRSFYRRNGYRKAAEFEDFYGPGDGKLVFVKTVKVPAPA